MTSDQGHDVQSADDAHRAIIFNDHDPMNALAVHFVGQFAYRSIGRAGHYLRSHGVFDAQLLEPLVKAFEAMRRRVLEAVGLVFLPLLVIADFRVERLDQFFDANQITAADDPHQFTLRDDRRAADSRFDQRVPDLDQRLLGRNGNQLATHDVARHEYLQTARPFE